MDDFKVVSVPFLQLRGDHSTRVDKLVRQAVERVLQSGRYILGPELERFESDLAVHEDVRFCVGVGNGLDALKLMLEGLGIGPGDEVIVPAQTFVATWLAVTHVGAKLVPVDIDPESMNLDPRAVEAAVTPRTAAILAVHLYGRPADMQQLQGISERYGLVLLADAAQSLGAGSRESRATSKSYAAATSFYPGKNLGALGDGGAILTDSEELSLRLRRLRNYGSQDKYKHEDLGHNSRLDEIQAAVLQSKLPFLESWNGRRREIASVYGECIQEIPSIRPPETSPTSVWHLYVVRTHNRDGLRAHLASAGIETLIHYPSTPGNQIAYKKLVKGEFPNAERLADTCLSLPMGPHLNDQQLEYVCESLRCFDS